MQFLRLPSCANMSLKSGAAILFILWLGAVQCEEEAKTPDCKNGTAPCGNTSMFTPPPAESMSRLLPSSAVPSNETKDASASSIDIITTPETETSLGLSAFSKFAHTSDHGSFNPSPFLGVISDKGFQRGVAIGEVFPDSVGDRHGYYKHHNYNKGYHQAYAEGLKPRPNYGQILDNHDVKPTLETIHKTSISPLYKPDFRPTVESYYKTTKTPDYSFVLPDKHHHDGGYNTITEYKPPYDKYPSSEKPIREDIPDDRPFGHDDRPKFGHDDRPKFGHDDRHKFPTYIHGLSPPDHKKHMEKGNNQWKGVMKFLATLIPFGILVAALSPSILVVNATDPETPTKTNTFRSLDGMGIRLPIPPPGVQLTDCQMKEICDGIYSAEKSYQPYLDSLIKRSGGVLKEIAEISAAGKCSEIPCKR